MTINEELIRPKRIFDEYLRLAAIDATEYFCRAPRVDVPCPACGARGVDAFDKHGFTYQECPECDTLFVSPRPDASAFSRYYTESPSAAYWASTFYPKTADARREFLWVPKARMIAERLARVGAHGHAVIDIGAGYGIFAEVFQSLTGATVTCIEPGPPLAAACRAKGLSVIERFLEDVTPAQLPNGPRAFVTFELFEHLVDPAAFLKRIRALSAPGDALIFTTLSGTGVDIRVLWEHSKSVSPPHHLNFINPSSVARLLKTCGFGNIVVETPGVLDIDIMRNSLSSVTDRFWRWFLTRADATQRAAMQAAITASGLSSHLMVTCRANGDGPQ